MHKRPSLQAREGFLDLVHLDSDCDGIFYVLSVTLAALYTVARMCQIGRSGERARWNRTLIELIELIEHDKNLSEYS